MPNMDPSNSSWSDCLNHTRRICNVEFIRCPACSAYIEWGDTHYPLLKHYFESHPYNKYPEVLLLQFGGDIPKLRAFWAENQRPHVFILPPAAPAFPSHQWPPSNARRQALPKSLSAFRRMIVSTWSNASAVRRADHIIVRLVQPDGNCIIIDDETPFQTIQDGDVMEWFWCACACHGDHSRKN